MTQGAATYGKPCAFPSLRALLKVPLPRPNQLAERPVKRCVVMRNGEYA